MQYQVGTGEPAGNTVLGDALEGSWGAGGVSGKRKSRMCRLRGWARQGGVGGGRRQGGVQLVDPTVG